mmetsp:Transcript_11709/g.29583  ORF Transcript_11709/g.29583 Transcript_11709/m.29583 type:complete len:132 (+) Transcript_11709:43-438(+)
MLRQVKRGSATNAIGQNHARQPTEQAPPPVALSSTCSASHLNVMTVDAEYIRAKLTTELAATDVSVLDTSGGCGASFEVSLVVSEKFAGKPPLARHRLVNAALKEELKEIHALAIKKTLTPEQHAASAEVN